MMHVNNETETWKPGDGLGMTLTAAGARRSHRRAVLSCEPLTNIHELHACREYTWPVWRTSTDTSALYRSISVSWQRPQCFLRNPEMAGTFTSCLSVPYPPTVSKSYRTILSNKYTRRQSYNRNTLAVPRKKDLSVKNLCFSSFYHPRLVWSPQKRFCWDLGYESWYQKTAESLSYPTVKLSDPISICLQGYQLVTDGQRDGQMAPPMPQLCCSTAQRDKNRRLRQFYDRNERDDVRHHSPECPGIARSRAPEAQSVTQILQSPAPALTNSEDLCAVSGMKTRSRTVPSWHVSSMSSPAATASLATCHRSALLPVTMTLGQQRSSCNMTANIPAEESHITVYQPINELIKQSIKQRIFRMA